MAAETAAKLELDDIQSGVLSPRPAPYAASFILLRIDDREAGRELMLKASTVVASAAHRTSPAGDAWVSVALTFQGLKALGVPKDSLESFAPEFQQGMAARARSLGDFGESSPGKLGKAAWDTRCHVVVTALARTRDSSNVYSSGAGASTRVWREFRRSGTRIATFSRPRKSPSDSRTASAIRLWREAEFPVKSRRTTFQGR